jgi:5-formyltetrahydrofolate cyclo-ligase
MPARWQDYAMAIEKEILRGELLSKRPHSSEGLTRQLLALVQKLNPQTLATYSPQPTEPDASEFNRLISKSLNLVFPKVVSEDLVFAGGELTRGKFSIEEPTGAVQQEIDLMLVPALAVDQSGNRLGKGKGFYDRYLQNRHFPRYAVVFDEEVLDQIPAQLHDQRMSGFVTPTRVVTF